jgi:hypothetical protein
MSDDSISRQWLMKCVNEGWIKFDTEKDENRFIHLIMDIAPSVQPEQKSGTWIYDGTKRICPFCKDFIVTGRSIVKYCWNCGARLKERSKDAES